MVNEFKRISETTLKTDVNELQVSKVGRAVGLYLVSPRNIIDKNMVLNFWPRLCYKSLSRFSPYGPENVRFDKK